MCCGCGLLRQPVHQIEIEVLEPRGVQLSRRVVGLTGGVNPSEQLQMPFAEGLTTQRYPVDARRTVFGKATPLDRAGIRFQGDLGCRRECQARPNRSDDLTDRCRAEQAGRSAAEEDALHLSIGDPPGLVLEIPIECRDIALLGQDAVDCV